MKGLRRTGTGTGGVSERLARTRVGASSRQLAQGRSGSLLSRGADQAKRAGREALSSTRPDNDRKDPVSSVEHSADYARREASAKALRKVPGGGTAAHTFSGETGIAENVENVGQRFVKNGARKTGTATARVAGRLTKRSMFAAGRGTVRAARAGGVGAKVTVRAGYAAAQATARAAQATAVAVKAVIAAVAAVATSAPVLGVVAVVAAVLALVASLFAFLVPTVAAVSCTPASGLGGAPADTAITWSPEQLSNAEKIVGVGKTLGLSEAGQLIGVQAAIGESGLRVLPYGDLAGPDSRGLFQQRDNGAWGSLSDRMDPTISATNFFKALQNVTSWETLEPSLAINRVQGNSNPDHYTRYRSQAVQVFQRVTGSSFTGSTCTTGQVVGELKGAGAFVLNSPNASVTSPYGPRQTPAGTADINGGMHFGVDVSAPGSPEVVAPVDLKITRTIPASLDGWGAGENVAGTTMDGKYSLAFFHMVAGSIKVKVGDTVAAGTPLGLMGATGNVNGAHVHVELYSPARDNPIPTVGAIDPVPYLKEVGAWK